MHHPERLYRPTKPKPPAVRPVILATAIIFGFLILLAALVSAGIRSDQAARASVMRGGR
jgi:hypothetical protein